MCVYVYIQNTCVCTHTYIHTHKVYIYNVMLLSHKNNEILQFATTWMNWEGTILSEISWTKKDKYFMFSLVCGI